VLLTIAVVLPWRWIPPPTTAFIERARAERGVAYHWIRLADISPNLAICVVAAEDQKFPKHHGFDVASIASAVREKRKRPRGASTLSQQVVKNLFLWPGRSALRKAIEAWLTAFTELLWPKRRILEIYLNVTEFGPGIFGAAAASQRLFGKSAAELTLREAALLAAVLPNPKVMSAARPSRYVARRATEIEREVRNLGGPSYLAKL